MRFAVDFDQADDGKVFFLVSWGACWSGDEISLLEIKTLDLAVRHVEVSRI